MASNKRSAGLLMYRRTSGGVEVFLVHPGGPFYARKDEGVWSIPKGEFVPGQDPLEVARREFAEETGQTVEACARGGPFAPLGSIRQRSGKVVDAWAFEGDWPAHALLRSNTFAVEWPPGSGTRREFPEVDRGGFFALAEARRKIHPAQMELIERLVRAGEAP
jgi:predicted NUDIX family NTP pyrophosphohydrolase